MDTTPSTNDVAWSFLHQVGDEGNASDTDGTADGLVVLAEHQSAGRGRLGRLWLAPRGAGVLASVLLTNETLEPAAATASIVAAVAAREAIAAACGITCDIKWPNDLMIRGRKVGGILVEARVCSASSPGPAGCDTPQQSCGSFSRAASRTHSPRSGEPPHPSSAFVIGIGINCLQHPGHFEGDLRQTATSLDMESDHPVDRNRVAACLIAALDRWLARPHDWQADDLRRAWMAGTQPLGRRIHLRHDDQDFHGHVVDLDPALGLVVELDSGARRAFSAATTTVVKLAAAD